MNSADTTEGAGGPEQAKEPNPRAKRWLDAGYIILATYVLLSLNVLAPPSQFHRVIFITGAALVLLYLNRVIEVQARLPFRILSTIFALASAGVTWYLLTNLDRLAVPMGRAPATDIYVGIILIMVVLEASRRAMGVVLPAITLFLIFYNLYGSIFPGDFGHPGTPPQRLVAQLTTSLAGVYGQVPTIIITVVLIFVLFGAVIQQAGLADFFAAIAQRASSRFRSGAAQTSVIMSTLFGSLSGASVANVGTTGALTIPLMRRSGFSAERAGGVESAASTASQIVPPILGTTAFVMASLTNIPYLTIVAVSIFPAVIFVLALMIGVHGMVVRDPAVRGIAGVERPSLRRLYLLLPVVLLVYRLFEGFSPQYASLQATWAAIALFGVETLFRVMTALRVDRRLFLMRLSEAGGRVAKGLLIAAQSIVGLVVAGAVVGLIVQLITIPQAIQQLATSAISWTGGNVLLMLIVVGVASLVLGAGMPTVAAYVVVALLLLPTVTSLGIPLLAAHMFVFYFGVAANLTPPVGMTVWTAVGLTGGDYWKTTKYAMILGFPALLLPFMFALRPVLIDLPRTLEEVLAYVEVGMGVLVVVGVFIGWLGWVLQRWVRASLLMLALGLVWPHGENGSGRALSIASLAITVVVLGMSYFQQRQSTPERPYSETEADGLADARGRGRDKQ